ncbi:cytochrome P450 [Rhizoctonia solani]|nr:cytochrome P450 [Rhizoctonia solani]
MPKTTITLYFCATASLTLLFRQYWRDRWRRQAHRPPSPASFPIVGNALSIPSGPQQFAFMELGKQLNSDIIFLNVFGQQILVLNSMQAASELLDKRSAKYSDRDLGAMVTDPTLMDWSTNVLGARYGELWRHYRRLLNNWLNAREVVQFHSLQQHQVRLLLQRLLQGADYPNPFQQVRDEFFYTMACVMFQLAYGYHLQGHDDAWFQQARLTVHRLTEGPLITNFLVNAIPALVYVPDWFPGTGWKRTAKTWKNDKENALNEPYEWTKSQVAAGVAEPSILSALLQEHKLVSNLSPEERDRRLKQLGISIYAGGTDSSANLLVSFVAAMVQNPTSQAKAQEELDHVLGPLTLPTPSDKERLPYVNNLIQEVMRVYPVVPSGVPHVCFEDDTYRGYKIPKGTVVIPNTWAMSRDDTHYPDPEVFNPNRYLSPNVPLVPGFGWGRRKCPGTHLADDSAFVSIASMLSVYNFFKKKDVDGKEIEPKVECGSNALALELRPFDFQYEPRSEKHRQLILESVN